MKTLLFSLALASSALAVTDNNRNGRPDNPGHVYSVPDSGSNLALLALTIGVMLLGRKALKA